MQAADTEDEDVRTHRAQRLDRSCADDRVGILVERTAENRHVDPRVLGERDRDRRAVRDDGRLELRGQAARHLERGRPGVQDDHLARPQKPSGRARDRGLRSRSLLAAHGVRERADSRRKRSAVDAAQQSGIRELAEIAADGVRRHREGRAQLGSDDLAIAAQPLQDQLATLLGEHTVIQA